MGRRGLCKAASGDVTGGGEERGRGEVKGQIGIGKHPVIAKWETGWKGS